MNPSVTRTLPLRPVYILTIITGSFLLFMVQPLFGRVVLPVLGGSPNVWNTAMLLYQAVLLAGYAYVDRLQRLGLCRQLAVHLGLFAVAALTLPVGMAVWYPATDSTWLAFSRSPARMAALVAGGGNWQPLHTRPGVGVWRDDFASVLPVLRWRGD